MKRRFVSNLRNSSACFAASKKYGQYTNFLAVPPGVATSVSEFTPSLRSFCSTTTSSIHVKKEKLADIEVGGSEYCFEYSLDGYSWLRPNVRYEFKAKCENVRLLSFRKLVKVNCRRWQPLIYLRKTIDRNRSMYKILILNDVSIMLNRVYFFVGRATGTNHLSEQLQEQRSTAQ